MFQFIHLVLLSLLSFTHIECHNMNKSEQTKEVFVQKVDEKHNNYIELIKEGGSLKGLFYGVEVMSSAKEPLYYKSVLKDLEIEGDRIAFTLNTFLFSNETFYGNPNDSLLSKNKINDIPFPFTIPVKYFGYKQRDSLRMNKISMLDDSKSTETIFIKKM